ncbi:hypothetical protein BT69DRAFT_1338775 [Atractiella rhizophila]|nr:hypothetical protein BT69DRAFT_1338775 [Atractiella rhizophila]
MVTLNSPPSTPSRSELRQRREALLRQVEKRSLRSQRSYCPASSSASASPFPTIELRRSLSASNVNNRGSPLARKKKVGKVIVLSELDARATGLPTSLLHSSPGPLPTVPQCPSAPMFLQRAAPNPNRSSSVPPMPSSLQAQLFLSQDCRFCGKPLHLAPTPRSGGLFLACPDGGSSTMARGQPHSRIDLATFDPQERKGIAWAFLCQGRSTSAAQDAYFALGWDKW